MAFPAIGTATGGTTSTTSNSSRSVSIPAGNLGDVVIVAIRTSVAGAFGFPAGWVELVDVGVTTGTDQVCIAYWIATSTGAHSITVTSGFGKSSWTVHRITGGGVPEINSIAEGVAAPDTTALTPSWGAKDTLWLTTVSDVTESDTGGYPTDYTLGRVLFRNGGGGGGGTNVRVRTAARQRNIATEDPGAWSGTAGWAGWTIAVPPHAHVYPDPVTLPLTIPTQSVLVTRRVTPSPVTIPLAIVAPSVTASAGTTSVAPSPVAIPLSVPAPAVSAGRRVSPSPVAVALDVPAPSVVATRSVSPSPVAIALELPEPTVTTGAGGDTVSPDPVELELVVPAVSVTAGRRVAPDPVAVTLSVAAPTVTIGMRASPDPVELSLELPDVSLAVGRVVTPNPVAVSLQLPAISVQTSRMVSPAPVSVTLSLVAPVVRAGRRVSPSPVVVSLSALAVEVAATIRVNPSPVVVQLVTVAPSAFAGVRLTPDPVVIVLELTSLPVALDPFATADAGMPHGGASATIDDETTGATLSGASGTAQLDDGATARARWQS